MAGGIFLPFLFILLPTTPTPQGNNPPPFPGWPGPFCSCPSVNTRGDYAARVLPRLHLPGTRLPRFLEFTAEGDVLPGHMRQSSENTELVCHFLRSSRGERAPSQGAPRQSRLSTGSAGKRLRADLGCSGKNRTAKIK